MLGLVVQEKSLGGLCRRFVQLFLVGNDVVSVAEAAEKLSDPGDVSVRACRSASLMSVDFIGVRLFHLCRPVFCVFRLHYGWSVSFASGGFGSVRRRFHRCTWVSSVDFGFIKVRRFSVRLFDTSLVTFRVTCAGG